MGNGKVSKTSAGLNRRKALKLAVIVIVVIVVALAAYSYFAGGTPVEFRILSEAEIPQSITSQVIPEYRSLERALACVVDDKVYVAAFRGEKPSAGYEINMTKMELTESDGQTTLIVSAEFRDPQPGVTLAQALTYPLQVAETNLEDLPDRIELQVQYVE